MVGAVAVLATLTPGRPSTKARFAIPSQICGILGDFRLGAAHLSGKKGRRFSYGCYPKNSFLRINTPFSWCPKMKSSRTKPWFLRYFKGGFNLVGKGLTAVSGTIVWQRLAANHNPLIRHSGGHVPVVILYTSFLNTSLYSKFTWARSWCSWIFQVRCVGHIRVFWWNNMKYVFFLLYLCLSNKLTQICPKRAWKELTHSHLLMLQSYLSFGVSCLLLWFIDIQLGKTSIPVLAGSSIFLWWKNRRFCWFKG